MCPGATARGRRFDSHRASSFAGRWATESRHRAHATRCPPAPPPTFVPTALEGLGQRHGPSQHRNDPTFSTATTRADWVDEALRQFLVHTRYLADPASGLWYHGWTFEGRHNFARAFWGRGNAWITIAVPELFSILPDLAGPVRATLVSVLDQQARALARLQNADGFFHTLLDDPGSPIEASATAGIAYGISRGIALGILPEALQSVSDAGFAAVRGVIGPDGIVGHVSDGTPMGHDLDFYRQIPDIPAPYGQALTMLMLIDRLAE